MDATAITFILLLPVGVFFLQRRLGIRGFNWRTWTGIMFGALVGYVIVTMLEPFLAVVPAFCMIPAWMWKLGMAAFCAFEFTLPLRAFRGAIPPHREESDDDVPWRRPPQGPGASGRR